jgi:hypothetical protein
MKSTKARLEDLERKLAGEDELLIVVVYIAPDGTKEEAKRVRVPRDDRLYWSSFRPCLTGPTARYLMPSPVQLCRRT